MRDDFVTPWPVPMPSGAPEDNLQLAARFDVPVLVTAESRDRRRMCARFIHDSSVWRRGPFIMFPGDRVGAAGTGDSSLSSGAPDVILRRQFEQGRGGTLLIDDIALLTSATQAALLSLLENGLTYRTSVGPAGMSVRLIAGASRHLDRERAAGAFCMELFYRLNVIHVDLIPKARRRQNSN